MRENDHKRLVQQTTFWRYTLFFRALQFSFTGIKGPNSVPARQCRRAQSRVHEGTVLRGWSREVEAVTVAKGGQTLE